MGKEFFQHFNLLYKPSPTSKHENYTIQMQIKHFTAQKCLEIALKCVQKNVKNASKNWFLPTSFNIIATCMPNIRFIAVAFQSEVIWRREPHDLFWPRPESWRIWPKTTTLVRDNKYFIPTKFHQNPSSGSGEEFENVKSLQTDGRVDGQRAARYDNSPLEPSAYVR